MTHDKKSAAELRKELRELRKEHVKPVSRMRVGDISAEIEKLRMAREETPSVASVPSAPPRKLKAAAESIKQAKAAEFPVAPADSGTKKGMPRKTARKAYEDTPSEKKKSSGTKAKLMKMLAAMDSDTDDE